MKYNFNSEKFHEVECERLFLDPNPVLTEIIKRGIDLFGKQQNDFLYNFTTPLGNLKNRITGILEHSNPTAMFPQESFPEGVLPGDFFAWDYYSNKSHFKEQHDRYGPIFLIFNRDLYSNQNTSNRRYRIKQGFNHQEGLIAVVYAFWENYSIRKSAEISAQIDDA